MSEPQQYRKRPVVIEAVEFDGSCDSSIEAWLGDQFETWLPLGQGFWKVEIRTLEGNVTASPLDWIIRDVQGEFYPCKPDIFAATYEPAAAPVAAGATVTAEQDGAALIAAERRRQVEVEGWSPEHDAEHATDALARAAACYATPPDSRAEHTGLPPYRLGWPWERAAWKPTPDDRVRELAKAGALIAAAIDALTVADGPTEDGA